MQSILAALLSPIGVPAASTTGSTATATQAMDPTQFKLQFGQAVAALSNRFGTTANGASAAGTSTAQAATTPATAVQSPTGALQTELQKKISDLLAAGQTVSQIVQALAGALANQFAAQFGGDPAQIRNQLQSAFSTALTLSGSSPPASSADIAAALAQRFRQVAEVAAGVNGETGQSNRSFAGSISDAATTAGVQPAPNSSTGTGATADSTATRASALIAQLTAQPSDVATVASGVTANASNGNTLLERILARAVNAAPVTPATAATTALTAAPATAGRAAAALAAAVAALGPASPAASTATSAGATASGLTQPAGNVLSAFVTHASETANSAAAASNTTDVAGTAAAATGEQTATSPTSAVTAFIASFTDALAQANAPGTPVKPNATNDGTATLLSSGVTSSQAPTIGAFAPVQAAINDPTLANGAPSSTPPASAPADQNAIVQQLLQGAFFNSTGDTSSMRLKLVPESLGDLSVRLSVTGNTVTANILAQTPAAHDALVAGQGQLTRALADAGLKLTSFNVSLAGGFSSFHHQQQQQQSYQQTHSGGAHLLLGGVDTAQSDEETLPAMPSFAPPGTASSNWGALNYLV